MSVSLFGAIAVAAVTLALATVWLFLTQPVSVANAVTDGDVSPLVREIALALFDALKGILKYL